MFCQYSTNARIFLLTYGRSLLYDFGMATEIKLSELQKAFALALKCSQRDDTPGRERSEFRAVAHLIWRSCGDAALGGARDAAPVSKGASL
jgi:hypothetical protein